MYPKPADRRSQNDGAGLYLGTCLFRWGGTESAWQGPWVGGS